MRPATPNSDQSLRTRLLQERLPVLAVYGSLAMISVIVFGTLSTHPF